MLKVESPIVQHDTFCNLPFTKMILNSWGNVSMCCYQLTQLGELTEDTSLLDLWNSDLAKEIREETKKGRLHKVCTSWNSCPFITKKKSQWPMQAYKDYAYPTYLEICLPDKHCNVGGESPNADNPACIMCRRNFEITDQKDITPFLCAKAKPVMRYLQYLCVLGIAEPFWKDAVFDIFERLEFHKYKHKCQFRTNTNGICLTERIAKRFFSEVEFSDMSWSLDAASADTHQKIRRLNTYDLVVDNLRRWLRMREEFGVSNHKVTIYNNINMFNIHEMTDMVEMAHDVGVDALLMIPTHDQAGVVRLGELILCDKNVSLFKEESEKAKVRAKQLGLKLIYPMRFDVVAPPVGSYPVEDNLVQLSL